jgi:hypothetical protein
LFVVQVAHLVMLLIIGFSKNFTLWKIEG